jgi:Fe-Mn family superoxide dismutase
MAYKLPSLTYAYDALHPHIDVETMAKHHQFHHYAYVNNLNNALGVGYKFKILNLILI